MFLIRLLKNHVFFYSFFVLSVGVLKTNAQIVDVFGAYIGTAVFPTDEKINYLTGKPENLYADFAPAQVLGASATKFLTDKWQLLSSAEFLNTFKPFYTMQVTRVAANLKYSIIAPDIYRFAPYATAGGNLALVVLNQASFIRPYKPDADYSGSNNVQITEIRYRENQYVFTAPVYGFNLGLGLDVNVYNNLSIYGEVLYNHNYATRSGLQNPYTAYNKSDLTYTNLTVGVKLYMY